MAAQGEPLAAANRAPNRIPIPRYRMKRRHYGWIVLFAMAGLLMHNTEERDLRKLGGLAKQTPLIAVIFSVAGLASLGLPLTVQCGSGLSLSPRMSKPARALGISMPWISVGLRNFSSASARRIDGLTPRSAKGCGKGG